MNLPFTSERWSSQPNGELLVKEISAQAGYLIQVVVVKMSFDGALAGA